MGLGVILEAAVPVQSYVSHKEDAAVHIEKKHGGSETAVNQVDGDRAGCIVNDTQREAETKQQISCCQILQKYHQASGDISLWSAAVKPQNDAVEY